MSDHEREAENIMNAKDLKEEVDKLIEFLPGMCRALAAAVVELQKVGFSRQESIDIVKARGIQLG
jgi:hypothetical protein